MEQIETALQEALKVLGVNPENNGENGNGTEISLDLTPAPAATGADFSTSLALRLAKTLHKSPLKIANNLKTALEKSEKTENPFDTSVAPPGFLNFTLKPSYWLTQLENLNPENQPKPYKNQTFLTEFSDPNPFKVLHVGHLYTSIVGDAISRLLESKGANVKRLNFGGDVGLHVAKNLYELKNHQTEIENLLGKSSAEKAELLGKCYVEGTRAYEDDEAAKQEITRLNKLIYEINAAGEGTEYDDPETAELARLYWWGREASYEYFKEFYHDLGLNFDKFYPESSVAQLGKEKVLENTPGTYQESNGAIVFKGEAFGLHTRVFINQEGLPTYEAKDVGLIFQKSADYSFDRSIVITGDEQKEYMRVVMKSIEQYAPDLIEKSTHLTHGMVKLPGAVKMSSRKGNFVRAIDVLKLVKDTLKSEYGSDDEKIALGAIKYAFLKSRLGNDIELDIKSSISMTGNSGPYLQYSAVRAKKILEKSTPTNQDPSHPSAEPTYELKLIKKLAQYPEALNEAASDLAPHKLATYLYDLAQEFSRFYENCPVAGSENEAVRRKIVEKYLETITSGLSLLGIEIPERM